ncbi:translation initiation factor IF-3 [Candidatus Daviesbacteria bacterium]|nr:translation initiation factor IF-3 [Candidatus Daviesbacteria bacterium]
MILEQTQKNDCFFRRQRKINKYFKTNERIQAKELRVIDASGNLFGVLTRDEALAKAKELGLDLVEIAPNASPPVAKILEFQKFRYEENKKEQAAKKHAKEVEIKELWFTPRIAEHDLQTRLNRVEEFLKEGNKIMLRVKFRGREMAHTEFGFALLQKIFGLLGEKITIDREPKLEGRSITAIIGRAKGSSIRGSTS